MATITTTRTKLSKTKTGKQLVLLQKQYELAPEIWEILKEYLLPKEDPLIKNYPVKIGESFKITDGETGSVVWWRRIVPPEEYFIKSKSYYHVFDCEMTGREWAKASIWFKSYATSNFEKRKRYREVDGKIQSLPPSVAYYQYENKFNKSFLHYDEYIKTKTQRYWLFQSGNENTIVEHVKN